MPKEEKAQIAAMTPLRRIAEPEDIARVVAFLAGEDSGFLTGLTIPVEGGLAMD
jgi:3-oxoacyl-[acyl-carrier protein] reductase